MSEINLDEIEKRVIAASRGTKRLTIIEPPIANQARHLEDSLSRGSGPCWGVGIPDHPDSVLGADPDRPTHMVTVCHTGNGPTSEANAIFIEHAFTDIPALIAEVRRLREIQANLASGFPPNWCADGHEPIRYGDPKQLHGYSLCPACTALSEVRRLRADRDHWKANHAEMVKRNDVLRDRLDLPAEKVTPRLAILDELDRLRAKVAAGDRILHEIACATPKLDDPRLDYVEIQIDRATIAELAAYREGKDGTK